MLIVFDMAGTTVNDTGNVVAAHLRGALQSANMDFSLEEINGVMGEKKDTAIKKLLCSRINSIHKTFICDMITHYKSDPDVYEIPGATETFKELRSRGIKVALNTGFSRDIAATIIERLGWKELIDSWIASDEVIVGRPYPHMMHRLSDRLNVPISDTIKVGDTPSDMQEGIRAGCKLTIGVAYGSHTREQLLEAGNKELHDQCLSYDAPIKGFAIDIIDELPEILKLL